MTSILIGVALGMGIGFACRWFEIPSPAPPTLAGAALVVAMTMGFVGADALLTP